MVALVRLMVCVIVLVFARPAVAQGVAVEGVLPVSGAQTVHAALWPYSESEIVMDSPEAGTWKLSWYGSSSLFYGCFVPTGGNELMIPPEVMVYTFWKDNGDPEGEWNAWPGGGQVCWPTSFWVTRLYSGSSDISYKLLFVNYAGNAVTVSAKFTRF